MRPRSLVLHAAVTALCGGLLLSASPARAQETSAPAVKTIAVMPRVGAFLPVGRLETGPEGGLDIGVRLLHLGSAHVMALLDLGFASPTYTATGSDPQYGPGMYSANIREQELTVGVAGALFLSLGDKLGVYVGAGPLVYLLSAHENAFGGSTAEHETRTGGLVVGGLGYALGPGRLTLNLDLELGTTDQFLTGSAGIHGLAATLGYLISF